MAVLFWEEFGVRHHPSLLEPRKRAEGALVAAVQEAYVQGVSTRRVDDLAKALGLDGISKSQVSRVGAELDQEVERFGTRWLEGPYRRWYRLLPDDVGARCPFDPLVLLGAHVGYTLPGFEEAGQPGWAAYLRRVRLSRPRRRVRGLGGGRRHRGCAVVGRRGGCGRPAAARRTLLPGRGGRRGSVRPFRIRVRSPPRQRSVTS